MKVSRGKPEAVNIAKIQRIIFGQLAAQSQAQAQTNPFREITWTEKQWLPLASMGVISPEFYSQLLASEGAIPYRLSHYAPSTQQLASELKEVVKEWGCPLFTDICALLLAQHDRPKG